MPEYAYTFVDIPSQTKLGTLPLYGVSASDVLMTGQGGASAGTFTGSLRMDADFSTVSELLNMTRPESTSVWMDRDEVPIWGGILWTRTYQSDGRSMQLNAQSFSSYPARVVYCPLRGSIAGLDHTVKDNPHNVLRFIWSYFNTYASEEYDIGVTLEPYHKVGTFDGTPDLFTTKTFLLKDRKFLAEYISEVLKLGCEYRIRLFKTGDVRTAQFESDFEGNIGVTAEAADYGESFEYPGELGKYWLTNSSAEAPTRLFGVGKTSGEEDLFVMQQGDVTRRIGVDAVQTYETDDMTTLTQATSKDLVALQGDLNRPVYEVAGESIDMGWSLGDHRRVVIDDPYRFAKPMSGIVRLTGWQLSPAASDASESLSITIADPTNLVEINV